MERGIVRLFDNANRGEADSLVNINGRFQSWKKTQQDRWQKEDIEMATPPCLETIMQRNIA